MKRFLISPPFGNWFSDPDCTRVMGSYTLDRRWGLVWNSIKSLRKIEGGWVNRIGLRNPGLRSVRFQPNRIYSVVGLAEHDWEGILEILGQRWLPIEVNLGCPNVHRYGIPPDILSEYTRRYRVSAKLPPTEKVDKIAAMAVEAGVHYLHLSNTIPTPRGGESGKRLKEINLPIVERLHKCYPHIPIIAGGGIYSAEDVHDYEQAGATHFSLSTVWFRPGRARGIVRPRTQLS